MEDAPFGSREVTLTAASAAYASLPDLPDLGRGVLISRCRQSEPGLLLFPPFSLVSVLALLGSHRTHHHLATGGLGAFTGSQVDRDCVVAFSDMLKSLCRKAGHGGWVLRAGSKNIRCFQFCYAPARAATDRTPCVLY